MIAGPFVTVELDVTAAAHARRILRGSGGPRDHDGAPATAIRAYALVDLAAEPPGFVALASVVGAADIEPVLVELLVHTHSSGRGLERDLLDAVTDRLRADGARRLRIGADVALDL